MIHVIAVVTAKPGQRDSILRAFRANVPAVRAEKGCIEYGAAVDADPALPVQTKYGSDTFVVVEKWDSMDALKAHAAAPASRFTTSTRLAQAAAQTPVRFQS